ncbi:MAG TPA: MBG domain-containing protein, partial [Terriglobales bacterium]|nr:MBG domain-containing protein [Terriglobales bacterium]
MTGASLSSSGAAPTATYIAPGPAYGISIANATGPGVGNYNITYVAGTMTLSQAPAPTVTAVNQTKQYGAVFNFLGTEFTATGLLNADKIASVTLTSTGAAGSATVVSPGPAYAVVPSNATGAALGNYLPLTAANYVNGTMTLSPAPLSVNASNLTKTYGDTYSFTGKEFTVGGPLFNGDQVSSASISSAAAAGGALFAAPGPTYSIGISNAVGSGLGNYNISYTGAMFTLIPRPLPVTAIGGSKIYGTVPSFAGTQGGTLGQFTVSNLVNGDTVTSVTMS